MLKNAKILFLDSTQGLLIFFILLWLNPTTCTLLEISETNCTKVKGVNLGENLLIERERDTHTHTHHKEGKCMSQDECADKFYSSRMSRGWNLLEISLNWDYCYSSFVGSSQDRREPTSL
jgi:hypothetical protein